MEIKMTSKIESALEANGELTGKKSGIAECLLRH